MLLTEVTPDMLTEEEIKKRLEMERKKKLVLNEIEFGPDGYTPREYHPDRDDEVFDR